jgi:hypothetical protein
VGWRRFQCRCYSKVFVENELRKGSADQYRRLLLLDAVRPRTGERHFTFQEVRGDTLFAMLVFPY